MVIRGGTFIIATLVILILISPALAGTTVLSIVPIIFAGMYFGKKEEYFTKQRQAENAKMTSTAEEAFSNVRTVKAFSNEVNEVLKFQKVNGLVYQWGRTKAMWSGVFQFAVQVCLYGGMCILIYVSSILYQRDMISIGQITAFLFYMILLLLNFVLVASVLGNVYAILGASDKLVEILQYEPTINTQGGETIDKADGCLTVESIKFSYPSKSDVKVLRGVDIDISNDKKRVVALCGTSGCGKSSIVSLLERFYDPLEGRILFNGKDIRDLEPRWYHEQISIV
jgi:ABC-type multidrug transport system fused ATPase/permease subunit